MQHLLAKRSLQHKWCCLVFWGFFLKSEEFPYLMWSSFWFELWHWDQLGPLLPHFLSPLALPPAYSKSSLYSLLYSNLFTTFSPSHSNPATPQASSFMCISTDTSPLHHCSACLPPVSMYLSCCSQVKLVNWSGNLGDNLFIQPVEAADCFQWCRTWPEFNVQTSPTLEKASLWTLHLTCPLGQ